MKNKIIIISLLLFSILKAQAQENDSIPIENEHKITISGYVDGYLSAYSNNFPQQEFQPFITVGARDNSFGLNVAQFGLSYQYKYVRSNLTLHWGDIPKATWSKDFNEIQEANVGVRLMEGLWLDAGFFRTHIGTESFLPKNNLLSSTAFITYNEPFYQAGAKLSYDVWEKWYFELWALNGYNNFVDNNDAKSVGALISYKFSDNASVTYTNIYGRESGDDLDFKQNRFYQNIYLNKNWNEKVFVSLGFDYGLQTNSKLENPDETASMFGGLATLRYQFNPKFSITGRGEIFKDENGFISGTVENNNGKNVGIELTAFTLGAEYRPMETAYIRAEGRFTNAKDGLDIFLENDKLTNHRYELLLTMGINIEKTFGF